MEIQVGTHFQVNGLSFIPSSDQDRVILKELPPGNFVIKQMPMGGPLYFERVGDFDNPGRVYGDTMNYVRRFMNTYESRPGNTGVLLSGEKGSGKSLTAKLTCMEAYDRGWPTIVINRAWVGDEFFRLLQLVEQPCVVLFDEFEKVYDSDDQEQILTLLDGVTSTRKLFLITVNDSWRVDRHMHNRPGRIFYHMKFGGLDEGFIREYCSENLRNQEHLDTICKVAKMFAKFNFDMLKALVEEMNRYNETPQEALRLLNCDPAADGGRETHFKVQVYLKGQEKAIPSQHCDPTIWRGNPMVSDGGFHVSIYGDDDDDDDGVDCAGERTAKKLGFQSAQVHMTAADLKRLDDRTGDMIFEKDGIIARFVRPKESSYSFVDYL